MYMCVCADTGRHKSKQNYSAGYVSASILESNSTSSRVCDAGRLGTHLDL